MAQYPDIRRKWTLATVFSIVFLDQLGVGIILPVLAPLFFDSSASLFGGPFDLASRARVLGFLIAVYPAAQFFGAPILGALSDRYGRKPVLLISLAGTAFGYLLFGLSILWGNLPLLFSARLLAGFTGGNIATANSTIADISEPQEKVRNFGIVHAAYGLGFILGPYTGGKLSDPTIISWFSYTTPFWGAAGVAIANICMVLFAFRETLRQRLLTVMDPFTGLRNIRKAFTLKTVRTMFIVVFLLWFGFNAFTQFFQVFLNESFGVTRRVLGGVFAYIGIWLAFTLVVLNRWVSRRVSARRVLSIAMPILSVVIFLHLLPREFWMYYTILPFIALTMGLIIPNTAAVVSGLADKQSQGEIIGIMQSMQALAMVFPPIISGFLVAFHVALPVVVAVAFIGIASIVYAVWFARVPEQIFHEV